MNEEEFLNRIANSIELRGKPLQVFEVCFSAHHKDRDDADLAKKIWAPGEITTPEGSMLQHLTKIYGLLEQKLDCPAKGNGKGRLEGSERKLTHYYEWIWAVKYPEYLADRSTILESSSGNPFSDRGRIENPARFFGREKFLQQLTGELERGTSIALVGEKGIGKSSILQYLRQQGQHQWRGKPSKFIYIDMQLINHDEDFQSALCARLGIEPPCSMTQFDRHLNRRGQKYILCLDELEMLSHGSFSFQVRANLRGLAEGDSQPLILVTASRSSLSTLFPDRPNETSPLADFCQQRDVLAFTEQETIDFIHLRLKPTEIRFSDRDIAELYQQTNGHPGQLQRAAADLFDRSTDSQTT